MPSRATSAMNEFALSRGEPEEGLDEAKGESMGWDP